jgi:hypothetical protein
MIRTAAVSLAFRDAETKRLADQNRRVRGRPKGLR